MKKFLVKVSAYIMIVLFIILLVSLFFLYQKPKGLLFVSNSICYNLKAGYIRDNPQKLKNAKIVVLGSSMSLNNINAKMIQDSLDLATVNLSSWGVKLPDMAKSDIWDGDRILLLNIQFSDLGTSEMQVKDDFSFDTKGINELFYVLTDFGTFLSQVKSARTIINNTDRDYTCVRFDQCGSILFSDTGFEISSDRWNKDVYEQRHIDEEKVNQFVTRLQNVLASHKASNRIFISFSPGRKAFYSSQRSGMVSLLGDLIRRKCPGVHFINAFDLDYPDSDFVDESHFHACGANKYTRELIRRLSPDLTR